MKVADLYAIVSELNSKYPDHTVAIYHDSGWHTRNLSIHAICPATEAQRERYKTSTKLADQEAAEYIKPKVRTKFGDKRSNLELYNEEPPF